VNRDIKGLARALLPAAFISWLRDDVLDKHAIKSYSQEGEDMVLRRLFEDRQTGFYVDVGAHHPKRFSNTYFFYKRGWSGINIDAMPGSMERFRKTRSRDINVETAVGSGDRELIYHIFEDQAFNSLSSELASARDRSRVGCTVVARMTMQTVSLAQVLAEHLPGARRIDFMSVDVEGMDLEVLQSNDWSKYRPDVVLVEMLGSRLERLHEEPVAELLAAVGYELYAKCANTAFFREIRESQL
jgi:FkbM family methyltransferase